MTSPEVNLFNEVTINQTLQILLLIPKGAALAIFILLCEIAVKNIWAVYKILKTYYNRIKLEMF